MGASENQHDTDDTGSEVPTVRDRLRNAHLSDTRIGLHLEAKAILLDGQVVTDLDQEAPPGTRINFAGRGAPAHRSPRAPTWTGTSVSGAVGEALVAGRARVVGAVGPVELEVCDGQRVAAELTG